MDNIKVDIPNTFNPEEYNKRELEQLKKSSYLSKYLNDNGITWDDVSKNVVLFKSMLVQVEECRKCKGLSDCVKSHKGYVELIEKNGICDIYLKPCKYLLENNKHNEMLDLYVYGRFNDNLLNLNLSNMELFKEDYQYMNAWNQIVQYAPNIDNENGVYLYGSPGVGKTFLMVALCNTLVAANKTVAFVNVPEFISDNKNHIDKNEMDVIKNADFVVFDDIGQESVTNVTRDEILFPLLNARMQNNKATCFTSNLSFDLLYNHFVYSQYGDKEDIKALRVMERIKALSKEVELSGKSRR
ncbi:MAG: ATP-binding protein [Erysipelotrichales bacterium]|nr:ATP-binding protein [Erysipelotrichales bacterium]